MRLRDLTASLCLGNAHQVRPLGCADFTDAQPRLPQHLHVRQRLPGTAHIS